MVTLAAVDIGTNSTRLLISRGDATGELAALDRRMVITRLGQGVDSTGRLDPEAIDRTIAVLRDYRIAMDEHDVDSVRMTATSASRDAQNRDDFFDAAEHVVGTRPELISGNEEGELSFRGATAELDAADGPFVVVDIGGGSTELIVGTEQVDAVRSLEVGCVRLTEKYLQHDPPRPEELTDAIGWATDHLEEAIREMPSVLEARTLVGLAGTITTVAAVEIGLLEWDRDAIHHFHLTRDAAEDVFRTLATETIEQRKGNPGLEPARADVIVGGCCVLVAILRTLGAHEMLVSEADILDGLIASQVTTQ